MKGPIDCPTLEALQAWVYAPAAEGGDANAGMESHVDGCATCGAAARRLEKERDAVERAVASVPAPRDLEAEILARLREQRRDGAPSRGPGGASMRIVPCPTCGAKFDVEKYAPGSKLKCGKCKGVFAVPPPEEPEPVAAAAVEEEEESVGSSPSPRRPGAAARGAGRPGSLRAGTGRKARPSREEEEGGGDDEPAAPRGRRRGGFPLIMGAAGLLVLVAAGTFVVMMRQEETKEKNKPKQPSAVDAEYQRWKQDTDWSSADSIWYFAEVIRQLKNHPQCPSSRAAELAKEYQETLEKAFTKNPKHEAALKSLKELLYARKDEPGMNIPTIADSEKGIVGKSVADKYYELGVWAKKYGMKKEADQLFDYILKKLNRDYVQAANELGLVLVYGRFEPKDLADEIAAMKAENDKLTPHERKVRDRVRAFEQANGKDSFAWVDSAPYLICIQKDASYSAENYIGQASDIFHSLLNLFLKEYAELGLDEMKAEDADPVVVWIYATRQKYLDGTGAPAWAGGHYNLGNKQLYLYHDNSNPYETWFHEGTHQLVDYAATLKGNNSGVMFWFTEGIATFFESFKRDPQGGFIMGQVSKNYLSQIAPVIKSNKHMSIEELVHMSYDEFRQKSGSMDPFSQQAFVGKCYAQSWSFVYFLRTYQNGKYKSGFEKYFSKELEGQGGYEPFKELFPDLKSLEAEWKEYILSLEKK